jgi:hypothetical protein
MPPSAGNRAPRNRLSTTRVEPIRPSKEPDSVMPHEPTDTDTGTGGAAPEPTGALVVLIDRLPAWLLPAYGCGWVSMPTLTRLASLGVLLDRVIATTDDAERTLVDYGGGTAVDGSALQAAATARGWKPLLVTDADATPRGWSGGVRRVAVEPRSSQAGDADDTALARLFAAAATAIASGSSRLVVVHVTSLGRVWDAPQSFRDAYADPEDPLPHAGAAVPDLDVDEDTDPDLLVGIRQAFAGQLTLLDRCLAGLLAAVPGAAAVGGGWMLLVAGLRGMPLGLHGRVGAVPLPAYGELVHVPAVLVDASGRMACQRYGGLVTPADIGVTLVERIDGRPPEISGAFPSPGSLGGLLASWQIEPRDRIVVETTCGPAIVTPRWQAVWLPGAAGSGPRLRLYAKPDDYLELCDVAERCPAEVERFTPLLAAAAAGDPRAAWQAAIAADA